MAAERSAREERDARDPHPLRVWRGRLLPIAAGIVATAALAVFYTVRSADLRVEAEALQEGVAAGIADRIETYLVIARQLSRTTARLVSPIRGDRGRVEALLTQVVASAPPETIFGAGAWYEPYAFAPDERWFGPYVHQAARPERAPVLTYEWTTPEYDFHHQGWYLAGARGGGQPVFTEPYPEYDQVYMSASTAFYDAKGALAGVATVDMVLPLLRRFVLRWSGNSPQRIVYVTTAKGAVFVHPEEALLVERARAAGRKIRSVLDVDAGELAEHDRLAGRSGWRVATNEVDYVGWTVHVAADPDAFYSRVAALRRETLIAGAGVWSLVLAGALVIHALGRRLALARREKERLEREVAERVATETQLTENKRLLEEAVRLRTEELARLSAGKDRVISVLAHDMRGLFTSILGCAELLSLSAERFDDENRRMIGTLGASVRQAHTLFENLLLWIRLHSDRIELSLKEIALRDAALRAVAPFAESARAKGVAVAVEIDAGLEVRADATMIETVIRNLCSNALKYTSAGGSIAIGADRSDDAPGLVEVTVRDTGIGVPEERAARLFDLARFSTTPGLDGVKGTGLGLQICREIVEKMGGAIALESRSGGGTCVRFTVPGVAAAPAADGG
jgi:signal transduction histidine kinase